MNASLARREASKRLGIELEVRYRKMLVAVGESEIIGTSVEVAKLMIDNAEFIIYALKKQGGLNPIPPEPPKQQASPLPSMPAALSVAETPSLAECTCPPLEAGIIGRDRHMTSCPQFEIA